MRKRIILLMFCFILGLSGCALFPLKKDEQPLIRNEIERAMEGAAEEKVVEVAEEVPAVKEENHSVQAVQPAEVDEVEEEPQDLIYCISPVNVREAGDTVARVIGSLRTGDAVQRIGENGGWIEIIFEGQHGYVYMDYMSEEP